MNFENKSIGIWGFGIVGKSLFNYLFNNISTKIQILDKRPFTDQERSILNKNNIIFYENSDQYSIEKFLNENDFIVPSPGIDTSFYKKYYYKFLSELDLFYLNFKKPIIAITGTLGKTTITTFVCELLKLKGIYAVTAGNIGIGMCDIISDQSNIDLVVLEVSSFQLEFCKFFSPNLALWTNFYPNHLDRHCNIDNYFNSKFNIINYQDITKSCLVSTNIARTLIEKNINLKSQVNLFSIQEPDFNEFSFINLSVNSSFFVKNNFIVKYKNKNFNNLISLDMLPSFGFLENWIAIFGLLDMCGIDLSDLSEIYTNILNLRLPEHRLEKFLTFGSIDFYNDSKSTIPDATLMAISQVGKKINNNIILFLGGLSKGVDRSMLIKNIYDKVKMVLCFGAESDQLYSLCVTYNIKAFKFIDLNSAVVFCLNSMQPNDKVLFSPAGSSFDLFSDYKERGMVFKQLVRDLLNI